MFPEFRLTTAEIAPNAYVVTLHGEADMFDAPDLQTEFDSLAASGARDVIVDLLELPFLDSTILGVLLHAAHVLRSSGGELTVVCDDARVLRVFEISGFNGQFRFDRTLAAAVDRVLAPALTR